MLSAFIPANKRGKLKLVQNYIMSLQTCRKGLLTTDADFTTRKLKHLQDEKSLLGEMGPGISHDHKVNTRGEGEGR